MNIEQALEVLKSNGYRVSKPKAPKLTERPRLNALGLPMSASFDPDYRMKHRVTPISRLFAPQNNFRWIATQETEN